MPLEGDTYNFLIQASELWIFEYAKHCIHIQ